MLTAGQVGEGRSRGVEGRSSVPRTFCRRLDLSESRQTIVVVRDKCFKGCTLNPLPTNLLALRTKFNRHNTAVKIC